MPVAAPAASKAGGALVIVVLVGLAITTVTAAAAFFWISAATSNGMSAVSRGVTNPYIPAPPPPDAIGTWNSTELLFFAGESGEPNLVATMVFRDGGVAIAGVAGATGKVLWRSPAAGGENIYTDEHDRILRSDPGKNLIRYDPRSGKITWHIHLADDLEALTFGAGCIALRITRVADVLTLNSDTGQPAPCPTARSPQNDRWQGEPLDLHGTSGDLALVSSVRLDPKPLNPDPPRLAVTATRAGHQVWDAAPSSLEPVWETGGFDRSLVFTPSGAFIYGRDSATHGARWVLLDNATGRQLYQAQDKAIVDTRVSVASRGPLAFVVHDFRMHAYRIATGAEVWAVGSR